MRKVVTRLWPKVAGVDGQTLTFRISAQETTEGPTTFGPVMTYTIGQDSSLDTFVSGRFLGITVESNGGTPWQVGSIDMEYREVGGF